MTLLFLGFCIIGYFVFDRNNTDTANPFDENLSLNPKGQYVESGIYTLSGNWRKLKFEEGYKFDYETFENLECKDGNGNIFYLGPNAGTKSVSRNQGYDLSEISYRTVNGSNGSKGSISFTNKRK